jgi:DNA-binding NtrC family response regulator
MADFSDSEIEAWQSRRPPRHFHLLSERDLLELRPIAESILQRQSEIGRDWYQQYLGHFGDAGVLSQGEFTRVFKPALQGTQSALLGGDLDKYAAKVGQLGELLAERGVPLAEVIVLLQLFKDSVRRVVPQPQAGLERLAAAFDKLGHVQILLLVSAYFRSDGATGGESSAVLQCAVADLPAADKARSHGLVGASASMQQLYRRLEAAATTRGNLLIVGESGTGKELVARAVHECGARAGRPFVGLNCAALPKDLIESELFGYKRGAFSGATSEYLGLFRAADGGTLFLDEITEMSADTQSKLLRAIQERAIRPVGSTREQAVDVRLIASTNRDPQAAVVDGHLRQDLYYRLQAAVIAVPPLRERREDIPLLVEHFIARFNQDLGRTVGGIEQRALDALLQYQWPGNVRELSNAIEGAMTFGTEPLIRLEDLPSSITGVETLKPASSPVLPPPQTSAGVGTFAEVERDLIIRALETCEWNKVHAAALLKISRKKLYAKINKYELEQSGECSNNEK